MSYFVRGFRPKTLTFKSLIYLCDLSFFHVKVILSTCVTIVSCVFVSCAILRVKKHAGLFIIYCQPLCRVYHHHDVVVVAVFSNCISCVAVACSNRLLVSHLAIDDSWRNIAWPHESPDLSHHPRLDGRVWRF